jgi:arylsulfatase A-like enzyme
MGRMSDSVCSPEVQRRHPTGSSNASLGWGTRRAASAFPGALAFPVRAAKRARSFRAMVQSRLRGARCARPGCHRWRTWVAVVLVAVLHGAGCAREPGRPNVLLVTVDTLRADQLGVYGFPGDSSPNIDALARGAVVFERALSASSRTAPSHASLFTSRWVRDHSIGYTNGATRLGDETTLAGLLSAAGYETAAFIGNSMLHRRLGLNSGFAYYDDRLPDAEANRPMLFERVAEKTTMPVVGWLAEPRSRPFFLWVQYNDPHGPYTPPAGYAASSPLETEAATETQLPTLLGHDGHGGIPAYQVFGDERRPSQYRARYTGEIRYFDEWIGKLLLALEQHAGGRETIVVLTADHGESLGEDDVWFAHGTATTPNLVHVPLLLRAPGFAPRRVSTLVHHVDVLPTLLDLIGLPPLSGAAGVSLVPLLAGDGALPERTLFADTGNDVSAYRGTAFLRQNLELRDGEEVWSFSGHSWLPDGSWSDAPVSEDLKRALGDYDRDRAPPRAAPPMKADTQERLRALGYLD